MAQGLNGLSAGQWERLQSAEHWAYKVRRELEAEQYAATVAHDAERVRRASDALTRQDIVLTHLSAVLRG